MQTRSSESADVPPPRLARRGEAPALTRLVAAAYAPYVARLGRAPGPMLDDYGERIVREQAWVLDGESELVGLVVLEAEDGAVLLDNIAVAPSAQGKGYGRALIAFAEDRARNGGAAELRLYTNVLMTENIALYQRLGFVETGRFTTDGFRRVSMRKALTGAAR